MKNKVIKVAWCCEHHEITGEQITSLAELLGVEEQSLEVYHLKDKWSASHSACEDSSRNVRKWCGLLKEYDIITGIFPPVALSALNDYRNAADSEMAVVFTPVSDIKKFRIGTKCVKRMAFFRWQEV